MIIITRLLEDDKIDHDKIEHSNSPGIFQRVGNWFKDRTAAPQITKSIERVKKNMTPPDEQEVDEKQKRIVGISKYFRGEDK